MHAPDQKARPLAEWPGFGVGSGVCLPHPPTRVPSLLDFGAMYGTAVAKIKIRSILRNWQAGSIADPSERRSNHVCEHHI
jgi:hypothetical protein